MVTDMQIPVLMSSDKLTQPIIAPVQDTLVAKQNYAIGYQFIYNNTLYKATSAISQNDPITIGTNAVAADDVTTQINNKHVSYKDVESSTGSGTYSSKLTSLNNAFFNSMDIQQRLRSVVYVSGDIYQLANRSYGQYICSYITGTHKYDKTIDLYNKKYYESTDGTIVDKSNETTSSTIGLMILDN